MTLNEIFLKLKQETNSLTHNPLLDSFNQNDLKLLDEKATSSTFIAEKKKNILKLTKDIKIDFNPKLKSAFDEYCEALTYLRLKAKFEEVDRITEGKGKTPDFKINFSDNNNGTVEEYSVYAELKSMSFADGNQNYKDAMEQGIDAQIDIEEQITGGSKVAVGITEIQPLHKDNANYDQESIKYEIEILIKKIEQNLKKGQFSKGETILLVDLKQLILPCNHIEASVPVYQEKKHGSNVSGIQWNTVFGKEGHIVYKPIDFEGKENIDGELEINGVFTNRDWIKAIVFFDYSLGKREPKIVGLYQQQGISDAVLSFLYKFCDFVNDDKNSNGWKLKSAEKQE